MAFAFAAVPLDRIRIGKRKRKASRDVSGLAASMGQLGLLQPIHVTDDYQLIAGYHRLAAAKLLKWDAIDAYVFTGSDLDAELIQIDENLQRVDLTVAERAEHLARRKAIYETQHPETKGPGRPENNCADSAQLPGFVKDTASKTGRGRRTIEEEVRIGERLTPAAMDAVKDSPIADSKGALSDLADLPPESQEALVARITDEKVTARKLRQEIKAAKPKRQRAKRSIPDQLKKALAEFDKWAKKWSGLSVELQPLLSARKELRP